MERNKQPDRCKARNEKNQLESVEPGLSEAGASPDLAFRRPGQPVAGANPDPASQEINPWTLTQA